MTLQRVFAQFLHVKKEIMKNKKNEKKKPLKKIRQIAPFTKMVENQANLTSFFYILFCLKKFVKLHHFRFLNIEKLVLVVSISQIVGSFNMGTKMPGRGEQN